MIRLIHESDVKLISHQPTEVIEIVSEILRILDDEYGSERDYRKSLGGYVIVIENINDLIRIVDDGIDITTDIPEYVDIVETKIGEIFTNSLILCNSDYAISIIMPFAITPANLKRYLVE